MVSEQVGDEVTIAAEPDSVMDAIRGFEAYPTWQREVRDVQVLETDEHGWGTSVRFVVDAGVLTVSYVLAYDYGPRSMRWHLVAGQGIEQLDGSYELAELPGRQTHVRYRLALTPTVPVPGFVRRQAARRIVEGALHGLRRHVEQGR